MNRHILIILTYFAMCVPFSASAASFTVLCDNRFEAVARACTVQLRGKIEQGDAGRLRSVLKNNLPEGWRYGTLLLESPGGSVSAALEVADVVRKALLDTTTYRLPKDALSQNPRVSDYQTRRKCVSACFLIWVAGADRTSLVLSTSPGETSDIGLHRPYLDRSAYEGSPEKVAGMQQQVMLAVAEYLKREQVPQTLIEKMLQRASSQVYWLTDEDPDITGRSPWFDEMMIARCGYDPTYDRESSEWANRTVSEDMMRQLAAGKKKFTPTDLGPRNSQYIEWRQRYNACEYAVRASAQVALRQ